MFLNSWISNFLKKRFAFVEYLCASFMICSRQSNRRTHYRLVKCKLFTRYSAAVYYMIVYFLEGPTLVTGFADPLMLYIKASFTYLYQRSAMNHFFTTHRYSCNFEYEGVNSIKIQLLWLIRTPSNIDF